jgi:hypothetical protein
MMDEYFNTEPISEFHSAELVWGRFLYRFGELATYFLAIENQYSSEQRMAEMRALSKKTMAKFDI